MKIRKIVTAVDSYKGCLSSAEANEAVRNAIISCAPETNLQSFTVSDGGEGWLDAFGNVSDNSETVTMQLHDPLMRLIKAKYLKNGDKAIIETAQAAGLELIEEEQRNPMRTTSYGVGEMIAHALLNGCRQLIVGLGGSAVSDAGIGMIKALVKLLAPHDGKFSDIDIIKDCKVTIASDVENPLCGQNGAAYVFGRQKGATEDMLAALDERARLFAEISARHFGYDRSEGKGAGAAGGLGYAFMEYMNAKYVSGAELLLDAIGFDEAIKDADAVITGEGHSDKQTLMGKLPCSILHRARKHYVPVWLISGKISDKEKLLKNGFDKALAVSPDSITTEEAMKKNVAKANIEKTVRELLS